MEDTKMLKITLTVETSGLDQWKDQYNCTITGDWYENIEDFVEHQFKRDLQAFNVLGIDKIEEIKRRD